MLLTDGYMQSDAAVTERLKTLPDATCVPTGKPPHIIMVHDESSFDIRVAPGVKVPPAYGRHFRSFDGKTRHFIVEGAGGQAGTPSTTCSPACRRARSGASPTT